MADWRGFCRAASYLDEGFSVPRLRAALAHLDPHIFDSYTLFWRAFARLGLASTQWGRDLCYGRLFWRLKTEHPDIFVDVPAEAVDAFNRLVTKLFSAPLARELAIPSKQQKVHVPERVSTTAQKETYDSAKAAKELEASLVQFSNQLGTVASALREAYEGPTKKRAEQLLQEMHLQEKKPVAEIRALLDEQVHLILALDKALKDGQRVLKQQATGSFSKLLQREYLPFKDLPVEGERIVNEIFVPTLPTDGLLTAEISNQILKDGALFRERNLKKISDLLETAKERVKRLEEMDHFHTALQQIMAQIKVLKDLEPELGKVEKVSLTVFVSRQELAKTSFSEVEKLLNERFSHYQRLQAELPHITEALNLASKRSEQHLLDDKLAIKRRLFEIFWNITPYQDLAENVLALRQMLSANLQQLVVQFYAGKITSSEFLSACQEMPYEHDVVKLRNEITHRSSRLKDLRDEAIRLMREILDTRRKLELVSLQHQVLHSECVVLQRSMSDILAAIENPFKTFSEATNKDEINYVFRKLWMQIEEQQPKIERLLSQATPTFAKTAQTLKSHYMRSLDSLEELIKYHTGSRPNLVSKAELELSLDQEALYRAIESQIQTLTARYPFIASFYFFMLFEDSKERLKHLHEAYVLDLHLQNTFNFAKQMQYVKTFEEERVDIILEAFEHQHLIEEESSRQDALLQAWTRYVNRMQHASSLVEEEIFLDIGLLDRHALMDVDQQELNRALKVAIERARQHMGIFLSLREVKAKAASTILYKKMCEDLEQQIENWMKMPVPEGADTDWLLEHLRNFCHYLFDTKVIVAAQAGMLLPKCLDLVNQLRSFSALLEAWVQEKRAKNSWGVPWIQECYAIRSEIESFEPEAENASVMQPLVRRVIAHLKEILEVKSADASILAIPEIVKELESRIQEIDALVKNPKKEYPFIYIPGYLSFFEN